LKKSETRRRLGEAPDIGTPFTVKPRRRNPWPLIVILVALAAGIGWWYVRTMPRPTDAGTASVALPSPPAPPATGKTTAASSQQTGTPASKPGAAMPARDAASAQAQLKADGSAPGVIAKPPLRTDGGAGGATAPGNVADLQAMRPMNRHLPVANAPAPASAGQKPAAASAPTAPPPANRTATPPGVPAAAPAGPKANTTGTVAPAPDQANIARTHPEAVPAQPVATPATPAAPAAPAVPQYYELAYATRKDIPQFNLSMHVFAPDAAARFVVADGERKAEGDTVKEGLILREIRTDGIVLEFRGQRFFYPRPGH
jgi:general secretion pathway protein B